MRGLYTTLFQKSVSSLKIDRDSVCDQPGCPRTNARSQYPYDDQPDFCGLFAFSPNEFLYR